MRSEANRPAIQKLIEECPIFVHMLCPKQPVKQYSWFRGFYILSYRSKQNAQLSITFYDFYSQYWNSASLQCYNPGVNSGNEEAFFFADRPFSAGPTRSSDNLFGAHSLS